jgi:c-di-AMP phosphodiesterase-like protein
MTERFEIKTNHLLVFCIIIITVFNAVMNYSMSKRVDENKAIFVENIKYQRKTEELEKIKNEYVKIISKSKEDMDFYSSLPPDSLLLYISGKIERR